MSGIVYSLTFSNIYRSLSRGGNLYRDILGHHTEDAYLDAQPVHSNTFSAVVKGILISLSKMSFILINGMPSLDNDFLLKPFFLFSKG